MEIPPYELDYKSFDIEEYHGDWDRFGVWENSSKHLNQSLELTLWPIIQMKRIMKFNINCSPPGTDFPQVK